MATPRWALYDCAELPGAVLGLCARHDALPARVASALGAKRADWLPLTFLMAVPSQLPGRWLVHSVCGLPEACEGEERDLRPATMRFAYPWLGARHVTSICQWQGDRLALHARWGALELDAAWLPSHDHPASCVFHYEPRATRERVGARLPPAAFGVDPTDCGQLQQLQEQIERGVRLRLVRAACSHAERKVWLVRIPSDGPEVAA